MSDCVQSGGLLLRSFRDSGLGLLAGLLVASSASAQEDTTFRERYRPQFHYTAVKGWINDPIGLLYREGEYHLFNDHNVKSTRFPGGKFDGEQSHWSHAVSRDLVRWEHRPVAVYPDKLGACWSGSGVVDRKNTTGFRTGKEPPLVLVYTSAGSWGQSLVHSNDRGRTWTKYEGNPVLDKIADNKRAPQVFWHELTKKRIMVRAGEQFYRQDQQRATEWFQRSGLPAEAWEQVAGAK
jgi:fructan beta-fructosidase